MKPKPSASVVRALAALVLPLALLGACKKRVPEELAGAASEPAAAVRQLAAHLKAEYGSQVRPRQPGAWAVAPPVGAPTLPLLMCAPSAWHRRAW